MIEKIHIYARTSTTDQTLEQQLKACRADYDDDTEFIILHDQLSGWSDTRRPDYDLLKKHIVRGWVKTLQVFSVSRLGRNVQEACRLLELCQRHNVRVKVVAENLDFSGPLGYAMFALFAALAQMESDSKSLACRAKLAYKRDEEHWICHGSPPHCVAAKVKAKAAEVYAMLAAGRDQKYTARMFNLSEHTVAKLVSLRGYPLITRQEFAELFPGWHEWDKKTLKALTLNQVRDRWNEVNGQISA